MKRSSFLAVLVTAALLTGCAAQETRKGVEMAGTTLAKITDKVIETTHVDAAQLAGGAQVISPGYEVEGEAYWVTGMKVKAAIRLAGVSAQATASTQSHGIQPKAIKAAPAPRTAPAAPPAAAPASAPAPPAAAPAPATAPASDPVAQPEPIVSP